MSFVIPSLRTQRNVSRPFFPRHPWPNVAPPLSGRGRENFLRKFELAKMARGFRSRLFDRLARMNRNLRVHRQGMRNGMTPIDDPLRFLFLMEYLYINHPLCPMVSFRGIPKRFIPSFPGYRTSKSIQAPIYEFVHMASSGSKWSS